jgi:ABC-type transporter Mla MlaB component
MTQDAVLIVNADTHEVLGYLDASSPDLALVDSLARMQLRARRRGERVQLRNVPDELRGLLELVGLTDVLAVEPEREPELREQLRVDEVVQSRDPPA